MGNFVGIMHKNLCDRDCTCFIVGAKSPLDWVKRTLDEEKDGSKYFTDK